VENARAGAVFLREDCGGDDELRREVESLIVSAREGDSIEPFYREARKVMAGEQSEPFVGRVLGRYRVIRKVGAGGMGEVYQAQDTHLPRKVALKLLPAAFTQDVDRLRRFRQEAYAASALNHPNIITVYEVGELDGQHFIATEFIEGQTLRERMTRSGMGLDETLDITIQIAAGLDAAHKSGIVHRDVKPENVIVRPDGLVKILDFGLAKLEAPKAPTYDSQTLTIIGMGTEPGTMMGTVNYMSPEQARGQKVDGRSDIFSLGVMLYELIAGKRPFDGETSSDVIAAILKTEPPPLRLCSPALPEKLERTVSKALRKNREERYPLINDLLADLKGIQQETVLETRLARGHLQERHQGGQCKTVNQEITEAYKEFPLRSEEADIVSTKATGHPTVSTARRYLLNVKGAAAGRRVSCSLIVSVTASLMVAFGSYIFFGSVLRHLGFTLLRLAHLHHRQMCTIRWCFRVNCVKRENSLAAALTWPSAKTDLELRRLLWQGTLERRRFSAIVSKRKWTLLAPSPSNETKSLLCTVLPH
jgi:serine/threonine protein kinase